MSSPSENSVFDSMLDLDDIDYDALLFDFLMNVESDDLLCVQASDNFLASAAENQLDMLLISDEDDEVCAGVSLPISIPHENGSSVFSLANEDNSSEPSVTLTCQDVNNTRTDVNIPSSNLVVPPVSTAQLELSTTAPISPEIISVSPATLPSVSESPLSTALSSTSESSSMASNDVSEHGQSDFESIPPSESDSSIAETSSYASDDIHEQLQSGFAPIQSSGFELSTSETSPMASVDVLEQPQVGFGERDSSAFEIEFEVVEEGPWRRNPTFHSKKKVLRAKLSYDDGNAIDILTIQDAINNAYERFVQNLIQDAGNDDRIFLTFRNAAECRELYISFCKKNFIKEEFLARAYKLAQSAGNFIDGSIFEITIQIIENISGGRNSSVSKLLPGSMRAEAKRSVVHIVNDDNNCGYYAVALGKYFVDNGLEGNNNKTWENIRKSNSAHRKLASDLFTALDMTNECISPMNMNTLYTIQQKLAEYQIILIDRRSQLALFKGEEKEKKILLEYSEPNHYNMITSLRGYLECADFCTRCWVKLNAHRDHICKGSCPLCGTLQQCKVSTEVACQECHIDFKSSSCYNNHLTNDKCAKRLKCTKCWIVYGQKEKHECDVYVCYTCGDSYTKSPHYCFIKPLEIRKLAEEDESPRILICYDIESMQVPISENELVHKPNLLIAHTLCSKCLDHSTSTRNPNECSVCGIEEHVWYGLDCVKQFCDYLYNDISPKAFKSKSKVDIIAHNQRGYDGHFLVQDFYQRDFQATPNLIMTGSKILCLSIENLRFIDSLSLFMQPLSSLCKSFNIVEMKKGFFPHLFNTEQNQDYVGEIPPIHFYQPSSMKPDQQLEFMRWYTNQLNVVFDFKKEIIEYCRSDVKILMTSILRFMKLFQSITGLNPIARNFTLASVAMEVFRASMLPSKSLGITPISGYAERKQSMSAAAWLDSLQKERGIKIEREWRCGPFYADGFEPESKEVFEFWGCYFHGCPFCYPDSSSKVVINDQEFSTRALFEKVELKKRYYKHRGYKLTEIWEHDFNKSDAYVKERIAHYSSIKHVGAINIRESFFGGRTNNIKFFHKCSSGERIRYLDFTSLYPYVLKKYEYPLLHPTLIQEDFQDPNEYFGFIKCKVLPPKSLNIAILPMRVAKKLMFPLCRSCAETFNQSSCDHSDDERALTNTWTSVELSEALKYGYKLLKTYQVLNYGKTGKAALFSKYVQMWLKIKQESSGWPSWCVTEEDKKKYISDYEQAESVALEASSIEKNPGKRSIAKLMLNSFWGKLAQNSNLPQTKVTRSYADLWTLLSDEEREVLGMHEANENTLITQSKFKDDDNEKVMPGKTNIAVASFVTAYARLELFQLLQRIEAHREGRVLYFDTDSVVFIEREGDPEIECGDYLGELTDEVPDGWTCDTFVTLGPKNYGYEIVNEEGDRKATIKVKGIKLTSAVLDLISIDRLACMANAYIQRDKQSIQVQQSNIVSDKFEHYVKTRNFEKIYRAVSEKRRLIGNNTRPYGYVD